MLMKFNFSSPLRRVRVALLGLGFAAITIPQCVSAADEPTFPSPDAAVQALVSAAKNNDTNAIHAIFGPEGRELMSPDLVQATAEYQRFVERLTQKTKIVKNSDTIATLDLGMDGWPFPIPLVNQDGQWFFDTAAGKVEILNRRIGMDELGAIAVCNAYVDAQNEYVREDQMGDGVAAYAQNLRSTTGTHDGLFWPTNQTNDQLSPLGPLNTATSSMAGCWPGLPWWLGPRNGKIRA
jgi:hypothetical protein